MSYDSIQINKICRTCLSEVNEMRSIFSVDESLGETLRLFEMLMACAAVEVMENDGLPSHVCLECVHYINRAFSFKQLCERSDSTLRQFLDKSIHSSFLELKPITGNEQMPPSVNEVLNAVTEDMDSVSDVISNAVNETVNDEDDDDDVDEIITPTFHCQDDLKMKIEYCEDVDEKFTEETHDLTEEQNEYKFDHSIYGSDLKSLAEMKVKSSPKKKKVKDDTEQPIYPCEECTQCFTTSADLKVHTRDHRNSRHICKICKQGFASASTLCRHMKVRNFLKRKDLPERAVLLLDNASGHPSEKDLISDDKNIRVIYLPASDTSLVDSMDQNIVRLTKLYYRTNILSSIVFSGIDSMYNFIKNLTLKDALIYLSLAWNKIEPNLIRKCWSRILHINKARSDPEENDPLEENNREMGGKEILDEIVALFHEIHPEVHDGAKRHLCSECGKGFARSDDLTRHVRTHTGEKPFICKLCGKAFAQSFRLLEHMRAHANEKGFICSVCGKAFSRYTSLAAHNKTHSGIKSHACNVCGKRLCGSGSLAMHMKTHTGVKDHICPFCGKGFTTPSNLIIHKRTHTGERPYVCNECGKGFPDPSRLTVHARSHSGEKPYVCTVCGRGCVSSSQLKKHMRIHTGEKPYSCPMCAKAFPRSEDLKIHIKTHTGDRNHICSICKKGFYQASTLKVHLRIHTGEKPYTCTICNKAFSQTGPLSTHMKTHS